MTEKRYHIYSGEKCIYHSLPETEFLQIWDMLDKFLSICGSIDKKSITYEEVTINREVILNSSH